MTRHYFSRIPGRDTRAGTDAGRLRTVVLLGLLALTACVPIPYKPGATTTHEPVQAEDAAGVALSSGKQWRLIESVGKAIQRAEPRVVLIDSSDYAVGLARKGADTLSEVMRSAATPASQSAAPLPTADCLLSVGEVSFKQLHDTGLASSAMPMAPVVVGYEKVQSRATLAASFVDLRTPERVDSIRVTASYTEMVAAMVYGVVTVARPQAALRDHLAQEVTQRLQAAYPQGPIRLVILAQHGAAGHGASARGLPAL
jgi:hypothetical protein